LKTYKNNSTARLAATSDTRTAALHEFVAVLLLMSCFLSITVSYAQTATQPDAQPVAQPVRVLTWWKSAGDHKAADILSDRLAKENIQWHDMTLPPGSTIQGRI